MTENIGHQDPEFAYEGSELVEQPISEHEANGWKGEQVTVRPIPNPGNKQLRSEDINPRSVLPEKQDPEVEKADENAPAM